MTLAAFYRSQPLPKPHRKRAKGRKARAEKKVKDAVRTTVFARDGSCVLQRVGFDDRLVGPGSFILGMDCDGPTDWCHMHAKRRSKTRGLPPEERHDTAHTFAGCRKHHDQYDGKASPRLFITAMTRNGADGSLKFRRGRTVRESSIPKGRA